MKVIDMGQVRDLLKDWDDVAKAIRQGRIKAWALTLRSTEGKEAVYFGGDFKDDSGARLNASMAMSWEMTKQADFANSNIR